MSQVNVNSLANQADTKSVPIDDVIHGSARAWVNFDGSGTVAIRDSYNVSSITDNGVGDYDINFTNPMSDTNYCMTSSVATTTGAGGLYAALPLDGNTLRTVNAIRVRVGFVSSTSNFTSNDFVYINITINGN